MGKIELGKQKYEQLIEELKAYLNDELDEQIGELAAKLMLDFILERIGPAVYNKAVDDMRTFLYERIDDLYEYERQ